MRQGTPAWNWKRILWIGAAAGMIAAFMLFPGEAQRGSPSSAWTNIGITSGFSGIATDSASFHPRVLTDPTRGGKFFIVWSEPRGGRQDERREVYLARFDRRQTTPQTVPVSSSEDIHSDFPDLWVQRRDAYVVWEEGGVSARDESQKEIYFAVSRDGGQTFSEPMNLSDRPDIGDRDPRVIASGNTILVVWERVFDTDDSDIFYIYSQDGGKTFDSDPQNLSNTSQTRSTFPQVVLGRPGTFYIAWEDEDRFTGKTEIYLRTLTLTPRGESRGRLINVSGTPGENSLWPVLASDGRTVFLAWEEGGKDLDRVDRERRFFTEEGRGRDLDQGRDIYLAILSDDGRSLEKVNVSVDIVGLPSEIDDLRPALAVSTRSLLLAWEQEEAIVVDGQKITTGATDIVFLRSEDGGNSFFPLQNLSNSFGTDSRRPSIVGSNRKVFVVWEEEVSDRGRGTRGGGNSEIFFVRSGDGGREFFLLQNLSRSLDNASRRPQVVHSGSTVLVIWEEGRGDRRGTVSPSIQLLGVLNEEDGKPFSRRFGRTVRTRSLQAGDPIIDLARTSEGIELPAGSRSSPLEISAFKEPAAWVLRVRLPERSRLQWLQWSVYDLSGRTIFRERLPIPTTTSETLRLRWPLRDLRGRPVTNGVYLYRVSALGPDGSRNSDLQAIGKLLVLR